VFQGPMGRYTARYTSACAPNDLPSRAAGPLLSPGEISSRGHQAREWPAAMLPGPVMRCSLPRPTPGIAHQDDPFRTAASILSPVSLSMFFQYWNARSKTGSDTPLRRCPATLDTSRSRAASSITSRTNAAA
jgi:hypothetical protein